jgi:ubiquinone/menaquinone biosynthesis C-methylase UbiE
MSGEQNSTYFEDHFSSHARQYALHRPRYPHEIYAYLASIAPGHSLAWDCGTGSGQAAVGLASHFEKVYATDASAEQISQAQPHEKVEYRVEPAEHVSLTDASTDLVTVAVALHWFDFDEFYREVKRVLKPNGILAAWTYSFPDISSEVNLLIRHYYYEVVGGYWPERIHYLEKQYRTLPFPFQEMVAPAFIMQANWDLHQFAGFLDSWSATQRYKAQKGHHPVEMIWDQLRAAWGDANAKRLIRWQLHFRVGRHTQ